MVHRDRRSRVWGLASVCVHYLDNAETSIRKLQAHPSKPVLGLLHSHRIATHKRNAGSIVVFVQLGVFRCVLRQEETDGSG